ncbi:MAG: isoprenyl transferase [Muribaculaceae bacterium]|nr:isoprenyl transferase [Muribaculaceae bacterium]MDE6447075.1 isoprenyl transferase [Muribaculaceae bacterium]MDE7343865.1 isoprenyl transferase [Muribaculaceae bacterium]
MSLDALLKNIDMSRIPRHVAIIMDGNGRWANLKGEPRSAGHAEGVTAVHRATEFSSDLGIEYLTLYAFSTENWNRPQEEVDTLMHLIGWAIERELPELLENNVRIRLIGDIDRIPLEARTRLLNAQQATAHCTGLTLGMCLSYSARWEIAEAARRLATRAMQGELDPQAISESDVADSLATAGMPDPDLLIRTGGEERISNFLLWQIAYSELYFTPILWPDFGKEAYAEAIIDFQRRERRFGKTSAQIQNQ